MNAPQNNTETNTSLNKIIQNRKALEICVMPQIDRILASNPHANELASRLIVY